MKIDLTLITRGDRPPAYTFDCTRAGSPALDLQAVGTVVKFMARIKKQTELLFTKTNAGGGGITVTSATQIKVQLESADTSTLANNAQGETRLEWEIEITEADGRKTTPVYGELPVRHDLG